VGGSLLLQDVPELFIESATPTPSFGDQSSLARLDISPVPTPILGPGGKTGLILLDLGAKRSQPAEMISHIFLNARIVQIMRGRRRYSTSPCRPIWTIVDV
jgi:hypothetical protein